MMIKTWEIGGNGVPYGIHPEDELNVFHTDDLVNNILAKEVNWNDATILGYEMVAKFAPLPAISESPRLYTVPEGYIWTDNTSAPYQEYRKAGHSDEDLIKRHYLLPVVAPSAVPAKNPNIVLDSKESLVPDIEKACKELDQSAAPLRDDLDPASRYYDAGGIETIDVIKAKLTPEQLRGYLLGNLIKYSCRMNFKGSAVRDAEKCKYYSQWLAELEKENV